MTDLTEQVLPKTVEEATAKMREEYLSTLSSIGTFITLCEVYSKADNKGKNAPADFQSTFNTIYARLKKATPNDIYDAIANFAVLELDFVGDIRDTLEEYADMINGDKDPSIDDELKIDDRLAIRDGLTDVKNDINSVSRQIIQDKDLESHPNDKDYDPNPVEQL